MEDMDAARRELQELITLIQRLRAPDGCPWDRRQTMPDIGRYLLDEAYEVLDALSENDPRHIEEELGDLLFQILFIAGIASEAGLFTLADVMAGVRTKMIRRHPHVFGDIKVRSVQDVKDNWQEIKNQERGGATAKKSIPDGIPRSLPALKRAQKITAAAGKIGFDWKNADEVLVKLQEELAELAQARQRADAAKISEEMGDLFFTLVNLSRFLGVDAEEAASAATGKFLKRFAYVADRLAARGRTPETASQEEMDALWNEAKDKGI